MKKIMFIFGTRPEAVKMAPIILKMREISPVLEPVVCITSQHKKMLHQMLEFFDIKADFDLDIMRDDQSLTQMTNKLCSGLDKIFQKAKPDFVLVQGDTTSAFMSGLMCYYHKIPFAHVEAGLRSYDKYFPFPEEVNRKLISQIADLHLAPTQNARANLIKEGAKEESIFVTGNTVVDALFMTLKHKIELPEQIQDIMEKHRAILVTAHRRESFGLPLENMCKAFKEVVEKNNDTAIIYPVHLNPNVRRTVERMIKGIDGIHLIEPVDYAVFVKMMSMAYLILTDSGGIQEEAPSLDKPVLVMRKETERPEGVEAGVTKLVGREIESIVSSVQELLDNEDVYKDMAGKPNPYGDGKASERIVGILEKNIGM